MEYEYNPDYVLPPSTYLQVSEWGCSMFPLKSPAGSKESWYTKIQNSVEHVRQKFVEVEKREKEKFRLAKFFGQLKNEEETQEEATMDEINILSYLSDKIGIPKTVSDICENLKGSSRSKKDQDSGVVCKVDKTFVGMPL